MSDKPQYHSALDGNGIISFAEFKEQRAQKQAQAQAQKSAQETQSALIQAIINPQNITTETLYVIEQTTQQFQTIISQQQETIDAQRKTIDRLVRSLLQIQTERKVVKK